ncbi:hypothetical protein OK016_04100 [Vibrio chagasii]|nr:hypothetical protein [Vibrio chagasii]
MEGGDTYPNDERDGQPTVMLVEQGMREVVVGMAHRGRLNMLVNVLGKKPQDPV